MLRLLLALLFTLSLPLFQTTLLAQEAAALKNPKWSAFVEMGSGSLINLSGSYTLSRKLEIGAGTGFTPATLSVQDSKFDSFLFNFNIFAAYPLLRKETSEVQIRIKPGFNILVVDSYKTTCFELTPELLLGDRHLYALVSGIILFTKEVTFVPQIGIGYRFWIGEYN